MPWVKELGRFHRTEEPEAALSAEILRVGCLEGVTPKMDSDRTSQATSSNLLTPPRKGGHSTDKKINKATCMISSVTEAPSEGHLPHH